MKRLIFNLFLLISVSSSAQLRTLISDGNWATSGIWSGGNVATTIGEDVEMNNNVSVTINNGQSFNVGNVTANNNNILTINAGGTLILGAPGTPKVLVGGNNATITVAGILIVYGDLTVDNNLTFTVTGSGSITIVGNVDLHNNASLVVNGDVSIGGNFSGDNNTNVTVNGTISVGGTTNLGPNSNLSGSGQFIAHGGCTGPASFCGNGALPIKLISFSAHVENNAVVVRWTTEEEVNVDFYTIQRFQGGEKFSDLTIIPAASADYQRHDYTFIDRQPHSGKSYYRLKETDNNGTETFFKIVSVDFDQLQSVTFFPNPVINGRLTLKTASEPSAPYTVTFSDLSGRIIQMVSSSERELPVTLDAAPGLYLIRFYSKDFISTSKIIVK